MRDVETYRTFSTAFKINIACEALPKYKAFDPAACGFAYPTYTHIGPTIEYLERAYDDAKYGDMSREPFVTPVTPTFVDDSVAPPGKRIVNLFGGHAPYTLKEGDWASRKDELARNVLSVVDHYAPGFSGGIIGMQVLTPPDIEAKIGSPHGHIFHGELQVDQLFWARPARHWADYRTPIKGLYQCGSSAHPGGASAAFRAIILRVKFLRTGGDDARLKRFGRLGRAGAAKPGGSRRPAKHRGAQHREIVLPWSIDS